MLLPHLFLLACLALPVQGGRRKANPLISGIQGAIPPLMLDPKLSFLTPEGRTPNALTWNQPVWQSSPTFKGSPLGDVVTSPLFKSLGVPEQQAYAPTLFTRLDQYRRSPHYKNGSPLSDFDRTPLGKTPLAVLYSPAVRNSPPLYLSVPAYRDWWFRTPDFKAPPAAGVPINFDPNSPNIRNQPPVLKFDYTPAGKTPAAGLIAPVYRETPLYDHSPLGKYDRSPEGKTPQAFIIAPAFRVSPFYGTTPLGKFDASPAGKSPRAFLIAPAFRQSPVYAASPLGKFDNSPIGKTPYAGIIAPVYRQTPHYDHSPLGKFDRLVRTPRAGIIAPAYRQSPTYLDSPLGKYDQSPLGKTPLGGIIAPAYRESPFHKESPLGQYEQTPQGKTPVAMFITPAWEESPQYKWAPHGKFDRSPIGKTPYAGVIAPGFVLTPTYKDGAPQFLASPRYKNTPEADFYFHSPRYRYSQTPNGKWAETPLGKLYTTPAVKGYLSPLGQMSPSFQNTPQGKYANSPWWQWSQTPLYDFSPEGRHNSPLHTVLRSPIGQFLSSPLYDVSPHFKDSTPNFKYNNAPLGKFKQSPLYDVSPDWKALTPNHKWVGTPLFDISPLYKASTPYYKFVNSPLYYSSPHYENSPEYMRFLRTPRFSPDYEQAPIQPDLAILPKPGEVVVATGGATLGPAIAGSGTFFRVRLQDWNGTHYSNALSMFRNLPGYPGSIKIIGVAQEGVRFQSRRGHTLQFLGQKQNCEHAPYPGTETVAAVKCSYPCGRADGAGQDSGNYVAGQQNEIGQVAQCEGVCADFKTDYPSRVLNDSTPDPKFWLQEKYYVCWDPDGTSNSRYFWTSNYLDFGGTTPDTRVVRVDQPIPVAPPLSMQNAQNDKVTVFSTEDIHSLSQRAWLDHLVRTLNRMAYTTGTASISTKRVLINRLQHLPDGTTAITLQFFMADRSSGALEPSLVEIQSRLLQEARTKDSALVKEMKLADPTRYQPYIGTPQDTQRTSSPSTARPLVSSNNDDDSVPWFFWLVLVVALCYCFITIALLATRKKGEAPKEPQPSAEPTYGTQYTEGYQGESQTGYGESQAGQAGQYYYDGQEGYSQYSRQGYDETYGESGYPQDEYTETYDQYDYPTGYGQPYRQ